MRSTLKYIFCFFLILFLLPKGNLIAQTQTLDSLLSLIKTLNAESSSASLDDTIRINTLIKLSKEYVALRDYSKAIKYGSISKIISEKLVNALNISVSKKKLFFKGKSRDLYFLGYVDWKLKEKKQKKRDAEKEDKLFEKKPMIFIFLFCFV